EEDGYIVVGEAGDGEAAVRLAQELRPDLVITDIKMPVLDGLSAAERIAEERIAPVVILTAFSQRELVERARDAGAMAYLVKPFSKTDLAPAIEMATSRYAELAALETEVSSLQERLATRKLVEQAKGLLQSRHGMSESEAFRWVQQNSMDRGLPTRMVGGTVVETLGGQQRCSSRPLLCGRGVSLPFDVRRSRWGGDSSHPIGAWCALYRKSCAQGV